MGKKTKNRKKKMQTGKVHEKKAFNQRYNQLTEYLSKNEEVNENCEQNHQQPAANRKGKQQ